MTKREEVLNTVIEVLNLDREKVDEKSRYEQALEAGKKFMFFQLNAVLEDRFNTEFDIYSLEADTLGETIDYILSVIGE
ncbi:hypothetical protein [Parasporobacterium paucivorans]|uniref:Acyl carrier protein n=1 Tax=Parasporobacterium paucivorans DSM 15970 TaxID=1122934 RepID=A0A1M6BZ69_9FIRM|nr:hypothetical protein [Parasporobacterium paucivorans]SHI53953.1 hypothetical protein SAMN02745691_00428 [Parasporobacterium paucivorans DSM 15970]